MRILRQHLSLLLVLFLLAGCAGLQERWDNATEDERARIMISQFQGSLKSTFILAEAFVTANPKYKDDWKVTVVPMFDFANKLLGDFMERGKAGEKFTVLQITSAVAGRLQEIEVILKGWGVKL